MAVIGITGGIGSGKSSFSRLLAKALGARLFEADAAARELLDSDSEVRALVTERVFHGAYTAEGRPDRSAIRRLVFQDAKAKGRLEEIIHPRVRDLWLRLAAECRANGKPLVVEIPLLFETNAQGLFDFVATVGCSQEVQLQRVLARGLDPVEAQAILRSQLPLEDKTGRSDFVVWNDGSLENLRLQVGELRDRLTTSSENRCKIMVDGLRAELLTLRPQSKQPREH
jgi:dephospho-CoA kinase